MSSSMQRKPVKNILCLACVLLIQFSTGCDDSSESSDDKSVLPSGWEDAVAIDNFFYKDCDTNVMDLDPRLELDADEDSVFVDALEMGFHCGQELEGFAMVGDETIEILIQPADMHPDAVARCSCGYDVTLELDHNGASDSVDIQIYTRGPIIEEETTPELLDEGIADINL